MLLFCICDDKLLAFYIVPEEDGSKRTSILSIAVHSPNFIYILEPTVDLSPGVCHCSRYLTPITFKYININNFSMYAF